MRILAAGAAGAVGACILALAAPTTASAASLDYLGGCANTDISPTAGACYGFYEGNANGGSPAMQVVQAEALTALGLSGPYSQVDHVDISSGSSFNFDQFLNGTTYISLHWGAGQGPLQNTQGGTTGFYRLDLADDAELKTITSNWGSLSNAVLWFTEECVGDCDNNPGGIPEPATWTMMIFGFGGVGAIMRRRRYGAFAA
jgi:hypothetical protein